MNRYFKNLLKVNLVIVLALSLFVASRLLWISAEDSDIMAATDGIDEIVVIGTDGHVYVYDYTGKFVYKSPEGNWNHVVTADLNNDHDEEIIAVGLKTIKVYDLQVSGTAFNFTATYTGTGDKFVQVGTGNLIRDDNTHEIALLFSEGNGRGRVVIYDPPSTIPKVDISFLVDWHDFAIGDYDGDGDDDFALIYWNENNPSGSKNLVELRQGDDPANRLEDSETNFQVSDSEWVDIASGNFITSNGNKVEWVGSQKLEDKVIAQQWADKRIKKIWAWSDLSDPHFDFLATADFRNEGQDQVAMLRKGTGGVSLRFINHQGLKWADINNLGDQVLNLAAGNVDAESTYREVVILKNDLIRIYRLAHSEPTAMDCNPSTECVEISGAFQGALALGDLGVEKPYEVLPTIIKQTVSQSDTVAPAKISIYGDQAIGTPITWGAIPLPYLGTGIFKQALDADAELSFTITSAGVKYRSKSGSGSVPTVPWIALSAYSGTTPATVTVSFSNTNAGSPIFEKGIYQAIILVWQTDLPDDRFRFTDVTLTVVQEQAKLYVPLVLK